jgi:geranylgeranyl pyrophosphate synthase
MLSEALIKALKSAATHPELLEVMDYAVLPAGKMFRPKLVRATATDLIGKLTPAHLHLASAIELHHAYTLVHDDLPAMDNDLVRRGKPSTHAAYGEWKAILAGDGLLIASFDELFKIDHDHSRKVFKLFSWATGPKGLIAGQFLDLGAKGKASMREVVRIHELKTARLIQVATVGSYLLCAPKVTLRGYVEFLRLGREIGVSFQLLDDLGELTESISEHEKEINPFLLNGISALEELRNSLFRLRSIIFRHRLTNLEKMLTDYFKKNQSVCLEKFSEIESALDDQALASELKNWLTSFV